MKKNEAPNNTKKTLLYLFLWSSAYFTVITLLLLFAQALQEDTRYVTPSRFLLIYPFGVMMALGNLILTAKKMKLSAKTALHYLVTVASFYLFLLLPASNSGNPFTLILILTAIYFIIAAPIVIVRYLKNKKENEAVPYKSQFSKGR